MEFDHNNGRQMVEEDRLSSLPDELLHKILSSLDMKLAVQTSVLSSRWEFLWTSMPCLNFISWQFGSLPKFAKFVTKVVTHRNHEIEVSSVKLEFHGAASQVFVRKIANYIFSHNVQQLTIVCRPKNDREFPLCLFSSQSLKHFTFSSLYLSHCVTPTAPWDFPALTTLHLSHITLSDDDSGQSLDLFSKCVNLKNLTLEWFIVNAIDIITPRLSKLTLIKGRCPLVINLIAPQLEDLTVIDCSINYVNAPPGISSLCCRGYWPQLLCKDGFQSLNKATLALTIYRSDIPYKEEEACKTINMLQELHSVKYLTLHVNIVECLSSFPDLLSQHPPPFSNLVSLTIDCSLWNDAYKVKMSTEARNFFLENSPNAKFTMELPEAQRILAMKQKEARAKKVKQIASHLTEFQALIDNINMALETEQAKENVDTLKIMEELKSIGEEMRDFVMKEEVEVLAIIIKEAVIRSFLKNMPKRERTEVESRYSRQLAEAEQQRARLLTGIADAKSIFNFEKTVSRFMPVYQHLFGNKLPLTSQMPSSSSTTVPTPSTSGINPMP